jgi:hypothetical protein
MLLIFNIKNIGKKMQPNADELLNEISTILGKTMQAFTNGEDFEMSSFDKKVHNFCDCLKMLPAFEAKKYEAKLKLTIKELTDFIPKLEAQRDFLEEKINSLNKRSVAYNAYGNALILAMQTAQGED